MSARWRSGWIVAMAAVVAAGLAGCEVLGPDAWDSREESLASNRARWLSQTDGWSYRFTLSESCECIPGFVGPVVMTVEEGEVTAIRTVGTDEPVAPEDWAAFHTIEGLFDLIDQVLAERPHQFDVEYDPGLGNPTRVSYDIDEQIADDERVVHVSDVVLISSP
jgi:hypothetical protein